MERRESADSGVGMEMTKKSRGHLDIVTEKADEEQSVTTVKAAKRDSKLASSKTPDDSRRKTDENKENITTNVISVIEQTDSDRKCDAKQQQPVTRETSNIFSSPTSSTNSQVSTAYFLLHFCSECCLSKITKTHCHLFFDSAILF